MDVIAFKKKWKRYEGKESSAYQEHFNDLCHLLKLPTPAEADPTGEELFCFQKRVVKDAELFVVREDSAEYGDDVKSGYSLTNAATLFGCMLRAERWSSRLTEFILWLSAEASDLAHGNSSKHNTLPDGKLAPNG